MVKNIIVVLMNLLNTSVGFCQNLIRNGDFEHFSNIPKQQGDLRFCYSWHSINSTTPDFYTKQSNGPFSVPYNFNGKQLPFSGDSYVGLGLVALQPKGYKEFIAGELVTDLCKDTEYCVVFYISWADFSGMYCNRIGYKFVDNSGKSTYDISATNSSGSVIFPDEVENDQENWHKISFKYKAVGGENILILGVFENDLKKREETAIYKDVHKVKIGKISSRPYSYFYIDSILVQECNGAN
jgi:hypothetical protein